MSTGTAAGDDCAAGVGSNGDPRRGSLHDPRGRGGDRAGLRRRWVGAAGCSGGRKEQRRTGQGKRQQSPRIQIVAQGKGSVVSARRAVNDGGLFAIEAPRCRCSDLVRTAEEIPVLPLLSNSHWTLPHRHTGEKPATCSIRGRCPVPAPWNPVCVGAKGKMPSSRGRVEADPTPGPSGLGTTWWVSWAVLIVVTVCGDPRDSTLQERTATLRFRAFTGVPVGCRIRAYTGTS